VQNNLLLGFDATGIGLSHSSHNTIHNNTCDDGEWGMALWIECHNNTITHNTVSNNDQGIEMFTSMYNTINNNIFSSNGGGIILYADSTNNKFYHNNFIDNTQQVWTDGSPNVWDDGYPSGGNYWSDYPIRYPDVGDEYHGENQDILGSDGIWDHPYEIDAANQDNYPLMEPWSPLPRTLGELKTEIEELGSQGKIYNQGIVTSLLAKLDVAQELIDGGKIDLAKNILEAFTNEVQAQSGKHITPEAADILIESAEHILSHL